MRKLIALASIFVIALPMVGCTSSEQATPQDEQFAKDLADAAAKQKGPNPGARGGGTKAPDPTSAPKSGDTKTGDTSGGAAAGGGDAKDGKATGN
jgi:hypothetical protein